MSDFEDLHIENISEFYKSNPTLKRDELINFLVKTELISFFDSKDNQDYFWNMSMRFTQGKDEIDMESCKNSLRYIFKINASLDKSEIKSRKNSDNNISFSNNLVTKALDIYNSDKKNSIDILNELGNDKFTYDLHLNDKKSKLFASLTQMTLNQYEDFRKLLSLIDFSKKSSISLQEIQVMIEKYQIVYFSLEEIVILLGYLNDQCGESNDDNEIILDKIICLETIKKLDSCLNIIHIKSSSFFSHNSENLTPYEAADDLIKMINNTDSYLLILNEYCSQMLSLIRNEMVPTLDSYFDESLSEGRTEIDSEIEALVFKIKNIEFFANHWKKNGDIFSSKLNYLKNSIIKYEEKIQNFEQISENLNFLSREVPINNTHEFNKFIVEINEENNNLKQHIEENLEKINLLSLMNIEKDKIICDLTDKEEAFQEKNSELTKQIEEYSTKLTKSKALYDILLNETLKLQEIEESEELETDTIDSTKEVNTVEITKKRKSYKRVRSSIHINDSVRNILQMSYEDLVLHTVKLEKDLNEMKTINDEKQEIISKNNKNYQILQTKIEKLKEKNFKLREENCLLNNNNSELKITNDYSVHFKRSNILKNLVNASYSNQKKNIFENANLDKSDRSDNSVKIIKFQRSNSLLLNDKTNDKIKENCHPIQVIRRLSTMEHSFIGERGKKEKLFKNLDTTQNNNLSIDEIINEQDYNNCSFGNFDEKIDKNFKQIKIDDVSMLEFNNVESEIKYSISNYSFFIKSTEIYKLRCLSQNLEIVYNYFTLSCYKESEISRKRSSLHSTDRNNFSFNRKKSNATSNLNSNLNYNLYDDNLKAHNKVSLFSTSNENSNKQNKPENNYEREQIFSNDKFTKVVNNECNYGEAPKNIFNQTISDIDKNENRVSKLVSSDCSSDISLDNKSVRLSSRSQYNSEGEDLNMMNNESDKITNEHDSQQTFSFNINLFETIDRKFKRTIMITKTLIFILKSDNMEIVEKYKLMKLRKIIISNNNPNLVAIHFKEGEHLLFEIWKRSELLIYLRDTFINLKRNLRVCYSDIFKIKKKKQEMVINIHQLNNQFITTNFENAWKIGYLEKYHKGLFGYKFNEKFVVLTDIGLLYFDDQELIHPKIIIPIFGSDFKRVEDYKYRRSNCFEIKTPNQEVYVFSGKTEEETKSWLKEFKNFKKSFKKKLVGAGVAFMKQKLI